jgi:hypothetical protein
MEVPQTDLYAFLKKKKYGSFLPYIAEIKTVDMFFCRP